MKIKVWSIHMLSPLLKVNRNYYLYNCSLLLFVHTLNKGNFFYGLNVYKVAVLFLTHSLGEPLGKTNIVNFFV